MSDPLDCAQALIVGHGWNNAAFDASTPSVSAARIETVDAIRGIAVLGILVMNIIGMAYAGASYMNPMLTGGAELWNLLPWAAAEILFDGKMRALFAMLFGASMLLMAEGTPEGRETPQHLARMAVLLLFGAIHGSLLWPGDILLPFAVAGLLLWPLRKLEADQLFFGGVLLTALQLAILLGFAVQAGTLQAQAVLPGAGAETMAAWDNLHALLWPSAQQMAEETALMNGDLAGILQLRHQAMLYSRLFLLPFRILAESGGLMLIGMGLYRLHWWRGEFSIAHYWRLARWLIPLGLLASGWMCWWFAASGFSVVSYFYLNAARLIVAPLLAIGYAALVILAVKRQMLPRLMRRLAACGRMALSNYVGASVLGTLLFTGVGLGLFGQLSRIEVLGVVALVWLLQIFGSRFWLERFRYGPLEWVWRSLARWQAQPWLPAAYSSEK